MGFYHHGAASRRWKNRALSAPASNSDNKIVALEVESLVPWTLLRRILHQHVDQPIAISPQEERRTYDALLRVVIRTETQIQRIHMTPETCLFLQLKIRRQSSKAIHLITHFRCCYIRRAAQPGIDRAHPIRQYRQFFIERVSR